MKDTFNTFENALEESVERLDELDFIKEGNVKAVADMFARYLLGNQNDAINGLKQFSGKDLLKYAYDDPKEYNKLYLKLFTNILQAIKKS
jgi:hypothetical protein